MNKTVPTNKQQDDQHVPSGISEVTIMIFSSLFVSKSRTGDSDSFS